MFRFGLALISWLLIASSSAVARDEPSAAATDVLEEGLRLASTMSAPKAPCTMGAGQWPGLTVERGRVVAAEMLSEIGGYAREAGEDFLRRQREEVAKRVAEADLVITTAQIPGRPAPRLISEELLRSMHPGAVVVDLAVESGGNCAHSRPGEVVDFEGVKIVGAANLPASVPRHASELYARNVLNLVQLFVCKEEGRKGELLTDFADEVVAGCLLTRDGQVVHERFRQDLGEGA